MSRVSATKYLAMITLVFVSVFIIAGCGGADKAAPPAPEQQSQAPVQPAPDAVSIKVATAVVETDPISQGAKKFIELLPAKTNGKVKGDFYPAGQLGGEREIVEAVKLGIVDFYVGTTGPQSRFVPEMGIFDLPYIFESREKAERVLSGPIGDELLKKWEAQGVKGLAWSDNGYRHMMTKNKVIKTPDDMVGLRFRIMESPIYKALFESLGATATPIAWPETQTALQTNVVDGLELPVGVIASSKIYKIAPNISKTSHVLTTITYLMNLKKFDGLPEDVKKGIIEAATEAAKYERQVVADVTDKWFSDIAADGAVVTEVDVKLFQDKTKSATEKLANSISLDLYNSILEGK